MNFYIMTLFPEMIEQGFHTSITGRAADKGILNLEAINIRDFATDRYRHVDDYPYGGGAGMVMQPAPIYRCYQYVCERIANRKALSLDTPNQESTGSCDAVDTDGAVGAAEAAETAIVAETAGIPGTIGTAETADIPGTTGRAGTTEAAALAAPIPESDARNTKVSPPGRTRVIYTSPAGQLFTQEIANELAQEEDLIILCGHYEGVDERIIEEIVTDELSIGDYVLTGGELAALVMMDAIARQVPGVLSNELSGSEESFQNGLLEYPQYTRPEEFHGRKVPEVLLSGHHANIETWRRQKSLERTSMRRPELLKKASLTDKDQAFLNELLKADRTSPEKLPEADRAFPQELPDADRTSQQEFPDANRSSPQELSEADRTFPEQLLRVGSHDRKEGT